MGHIISYRIVRQTVDANFRPLSVIILCAGDRLTENGMICYIKVHRDCMLPRTPLAPGNGCKLPPLFVEFSQAHS